MNPLLFGGLLDIGKAIIAKVWPDPVAQAEAQLKLAQLAQTGELKELEIRMSAILAEAQSSDPWTSRARPSFLYVMYIIILLSIPVGLVSVFYPDEAKNFATGMTAFLAAIPDSLWTLFGAGYLGYAGARTYEKAKGKA